MTNVEYRCPNCQSRLFAEPGGTRLRCPRCDIRYEQTEEFSGENKFAFKDEKGAVHVSNPDEAAIVSMSDEDAKEYLRVEIGKLTGKKGDGRMTKENLLEDLQKLRNEHSPLTIDTTAQVEV